MSEPIADDQPYATFVYNHDDGRQFVDRRCYERLRAMLRWIPVEERLPESGETVLVWHHGEVQMAWLNHFTNGVAYFVRDTHYNFEPTHWMPLPEPPTCATSHR